ncbi:hypothetical protein LMG33818_000013 [Halomonadaceae bacterium LMG 33818]|uniref:YdaS family helix-turn-helix protein n=1 Tax=Cernens ardua TaxID=3402176 RepID=UPI003EDBF96B
MYYREALTKAVKDAGGQSKLAEFCNVTQQAVQQWVSSGKVPPSRVRDVVEASRNSVTEHELRPDIFGEKPAA